MFVNIKNTCSEVGFAPGTQNGIKLGLIRPQLIFSCSIQGLYGEEQCIRINMSLCQVIYNIKTTKVNEADCTWASCLAREMSTASRSSRLPYKIKISIFNIKSENSCQDERGIQIIKVYYICTWAREIRSLRKWPEVSPLIEFSSVFL